MDAHQKATKASGRSVNIPPAYSAKPGGVSDAASAIGIQYSQRHFQGEMAVA
jgi:hypothetical protein